METKQTAVEYLYEIAKLGKHIEIGDWTKAKQMETEQIKQAHNTGFVDAYDWPHKRNAEQYYNETYGN